MQVPEVLDDNGLFDIHNQQGVQLLLGFEGLDVTARTYWFEISTGFRKQLTNGATSDQKILEITPEELVDLLNKTATYVVLDETSTLHELIMEGQIKVRGF